MSVAEMKQKVIEKITLIEDETMIRKIAQLVDEKSKPRPSIEDIFEKAKVQFGETLQRLAQ